MIDSNCTNVEMLAPEAHCPNNNLHQNQNNRPNAHSQNNERLEANPADDDGDDDTENKQENSPPHNLQTHDKNLNSIEDTVIVEIDAPRFMEAMTPMMKVDATTTDTRKLITVSNRQNHQSSSSSSSYYGNDNDNDDLEILPNDEPSLDWKLQFQTKLYNRSKEQLVLLEAYHNILADQRADATLGASLRSSSNLSSRSDTHNQHYNNQNNNSSHHSHHLRNSESSVGSSSNSKTNTTTRQQQHPARFILISGHNGTGKTELGKTLQPHVTNDGGYFLLGKFDQLERPEPYRAIVAAFTQYTDLVLQQDDAVIVAVRNRIVTAMGHELNVLTAILPSICKIVGGTPPEACPMGGCHGGRRCFSVLKTFVSAICSADRPIVMLFDDVHYGDLCSLNMIRNFVSHSHEVCPGSLVLVGSSLNTIAPSSRLATVLRAMEDEDGTQITNIACGDLLESSSSVLQQLVQETFCLSEDECQELTTDIVHQTNGNMLYVMHFLNWAEEEGLLRYINQGKWKWEQQEYLLTIEAHRKGDFLTDILSWLPHDVKEVLKLAACLGETVDETLLSILIEAPIGARLQLAAEKGALLTLTNHSETKHTYQFPTDTLQRAAYNLIPKEEREQFHLDLGRLLLSKLNNNHNNSEKMMEQYLFTLLSQLRIGAPLLTDQMEKHAIAMVCLHAGKSAARSSAFRAGSEYLLFGISLLTKRKWMGKESELCLALYNAAAEVLLCLSDFERVDALLEETLANTRHCCDRLQARCTQIYSLGLRDRQQEAIDLGVEVLATMDFTFPKRLCKAHLIGEMKHVERALKGKRDDELLRLPRMMEFKPLMAMRILSIVTLDCMVTRPKLSPFVTLKMMSLTMKYGISEHASAAFGIYGMLCLGVRGKMDEGYRFGQLALQLLDMYKMDEYLPRVYASVYGVLGAWKKPLKDTLQPLIHGHRVGVLTGDSEFAALNANLYCFNKAWSGSSLVEVDKDFKKFRSWMRSQKQETGLRFAEPFLHLVRTLMGKTEDPMNTTFLDGQLKHAKEKNNARLEAGVYKYKLIIGFLFNDTTIKDEVFQKSDTPDSTDIFTAIQITFQALFCLRLAREGYKKRKSLGLARKVLRKLKEYSEKSPHNFADKVLLVEAELYSVLGKLDKAYEKFTCAIAMAAASGFTWCHAIALERAAWHVFRQPNPDVSLAQSYFDKACTKYEEWGAFAKVEDLRMEVSSVFGPIKVAMANTGMDCNNC